jgi:hypothetical protein
MTLRSHQQLAHLLVRTRRQNINVVCSSAGSRRVDELMSNEKARCAAADGLGH